MSLRAALAAFDEPALVTLANVGLYRRAVRDVAEGKAVVVELTGDAAIVTVDGQRVAIDARGPKAAACGCAAPGVCRHRLATVLLLQGLDLPELGLAAADAARPLDPVEVLAPFEAVALERWAGKAAWRAALEIAAGSAVVTIEESALTVAFAHPEPVVRILRGQGADGIVSKAARARQKPLHAAAVLAARRHFGLADPETAPPSPPEAAGPPLPDPAFLRRIEAALGDCALFAFNLAPEPIEEQLFALSVSSRADALPRLGRLLRTLAAQLRLKRQRAFTFDPDLCLETLATAYALVRALAGTTAATDPTRLRDLSGVYRQTFVPQGPLRLVGCGADRWRTESGARGVTGIFYDPAADRWVSYAHARAPGQDPLFDPAQAYASAALWGGMTLQQLCGATVLLEGVGVSQSGRLSNPAGATASVDATLLDCSAWHARIDDWSALATRLAGRAGLGVMRSTAADFVVLAPRRFAQPYFDDLAQDLIWPVEDASGQWLALALPHGDGAGPMIERIENLGRRGWRGEIVVRVRQTLDRTTLAPVAIIAGNTPLSLALDRIERPPREGQRWDEGWLRFASGLRGVQQGFTPAPMEATAMALSSVWQSLIDLAEAGLDRGRPAPLEALRRSAVALDQLGYTLLADRCATLALHPRRDYLPTAYAVLLARSQGARLPTLWPRSRSSNRS